MPKRTHSSVTEEPCRCNHLQRAADDPRNPIVFDQDTSEYWFAYDNGNLIIYHCPFCGGAAPESKRSLLFARIPDSEEGRLSHLLEPVNTIDDALARLGEPDYDGHCKTERPESENQAPQIEHHRHIRYEGLSDVADVWITERSDGKVFWQLQGKYLGDQSSGTSRDDDG